MRFIHRAVRHMRGRTHDGYDHFAAEARADQSANSLMTSWAIHHRSAHFHCRRRPDVEPVRRLELSRLLAGISVDSGRRQVWDGDSETATEILGGCIDAQIVDGGPEIELTTG